MGTSSIGRISQGLASWLLVAGFITTVGCSGGSGGGGHVDLNVPPVITSFTANPATIIAGLSSTLSWSVSGAESYSIDNGIGVVNGGSVSVLPKTTTTYTLTATSHMGKSSTAQAKVTVNPATGPMLAVYAGAPSAAGFADGTGTNARFNGPSGVAVGPAGTLFVADSQNGAIRTVSPDGLVSTFANLGRQGDGAFGSLAADSQGNLYFGGQAQAGDYYNDQVIWKMAPDGKVGLFASRDTTGMRIGRFIQAVDAAGNVYTSDEGLFQKISPSGTVTLFGQGSNPYGWGRVAVDRTGNIYYTDTQNYTICRITPDGKEDFFAGTPGSSGYADGTGTSAKFSALGEITVDGAGNVYVYDRGMIRKITPAGVVSTLAGQFDDPGGVVDGTGAQARFMYPEGMACDASNTLFISDYGTIRKISPAGTVTTLAGSPSGTYASGAWGQCLSAGADGRLYWVTSSAKYNYMPRSAVYSVSPSGILSLFAGSEEEYGSTDGTGGQARFSGPEGLAVGPDGTVYVVDAGNYTIRKITPAAVVSTIAGTVKHSASVDGQGTAAAFCGPRQVAVDAQGTLYVTEIAAVRKVTPQGAVSTLAGSNTLELGSVDGPALSARFQYPYGIAVDAAGNVYVADTQDHTIRKITPAGIVSTIAGSHGQAGVADGVGTAARFNLPLGLAMATDGNLYVADYGNATVRKITPDGTVSTFLGVAGICANVPGALPGKLAWPQSVALDPTGRNLFITVPGAILTAPK